MQALMKAVWYDRTGPAQEVLQYGESPTPIPAAVEVRVQLVFSAVNPADTNRRAGSMHMMEFPRIVPHSDGAGTVDDVGLEHGACLGIPCMTVYCSLGDLEDLAGTHVLAIAAQHATSWARCWWHAIDGNAWL